MITEVVVDVLVLGAGAAGLSASVALAQAGMKPLIVEARDRIGGRIFTLYDPDLQAAIELGAEFIHGLPPEIWQILQNQNVAPIEMEGDDWCFRRGKLSQCDFFSEVDKLLNRLSDEGVDESFADFMAREGGRVSEETRQWALGYITGFHAADPTRISVHSLAKSAMADDKIDGHRSFRIPQGYGWLVEYFRQTLERLAIRTELNTVVERIEWARGQTRVFGLQRNQPIAFAAKRLLITVPLGVLQSGSIQFSPELPTEKRNAMAHLAMGKVMRVNLRFRERFWEPIQPEPERPSRTLSDTAFLFSREPWFPTWWTTMPRRLPILTAWSPFPDAERLSGQGTESVVQKAIDTLARLLSQPPGPLSSHLAEVHYHDWEADPFARGAYSYVCVGGNHAEEDLGNPIDKTLFFAGEATDVSRHNGTVHGAIASGRRAAAEIKASRAVD